MVKRWQRPPKVGKPKFREGYRDLVLYSVNWGERKRLFPYLPDGTLDPEALEEIKHLFRDKDTGAEHDIHPRLVKLLYKLADRFKARQINVISGYRESNEPVHESNHGKGRAVDFMIPGVGLGPVVYQTRLLGHVGVGMYPRANFVHLDVRNGPSYFWVDRSGPGRASCLHRILTKTAAKMDRRWRPKHDEPRQHRDKKGEPLGAVESVTTLAKAPQIEQPTAGED